mmetsp:Transcript_25177/g.87872  ORF Transcript_25177/g.87872 Transcript_25177/m.87872 type:complete len:345 (-) Transcript_25177:253-1287(-)
MRSSKEPASFGCRREFSLGWKVHSAYIGLLASPSVLRRRMFSWRRARSSSLRFKKSARTSAQFFGFVATSFGLPVAGSNTTFFAMRNCGVDFFMASSSLASFCACVSFSRVKKSVCTSPHASRGRNRRPEHRSFWHRLMFAFHSEYVWYWPQSGHTLRSCRALYAFSPTACSMPDRRACSLLSMRMRNMAPPPDAATISRLFFPIFGVNLQFFASSSEENLARGLRSNGTASSSMRFCRHTDFFSLRIFFCARIVDTNALRSIALTRGFTGASEPGSLPSTDARTGPVLTPTGPESLTPNTFNPCRDRRMCSVAPSASSTSGRIVGSPDGMGAPGPPDPPLALP